MNVKVQEFFEVIGEKDFALRKKDQEVQALRKEIKTLTEQLERLSNDTQSE